MILWRLSDGSQLKKFEGHGGFVNDVRFDGSKIVSGDENGCLKVWDAVRILGFILHQCN